MPVLLMPPSSSCFHNHHHDVDDIKVMKSGERNSVTWRRESAQCQAGTSYFEEGERERPRDCGVPSDEEACDSIKRDSSSSSFFLFPCFHNNSN